MSHALRFHVGDVTDSTAKIMYSTLVDADVSLSIDGIAVDSGRTDVHTNGDYIGTGYFTVTGLSEFRRHTFTISQGAESYPGSFWTMPPAGQKFSFIMQTCTSYLATASLVFRAMQETIEAYESTAPVVWLADIDDVMYVDSLVVASPLMLTASSGEPQDTGLQSDYANGWAAWHGHEPRFVNMQDPYFQWTLRNVSRGCMGGDHMVAGNHCRGPDSEGGTWGGCDRTLEATAKTVWNAFIGDGNPTRLTANSLNWGKQIGPIRFAAWDEFSFADPYDFTNAAESRATHPMYGAQQLSDLMGYLDTDVVPIKCALMSTGFSRAGQPWRERWTDEADDWHANMLTGSNLDGTLGWFFGLVGDNHTLHAQSFHAGTGTGFWTFCPGTTGASNSVLSQSNVTHQIGNKTGNARYYRFTSKGDVNGSYRFGAFLHLIVHADESPVRIECRAVEIGGNEVFRYQITAESGNDNQWRNTRRARIC